MIQIILAGVGGQGILFSSRLFSELGLKLGLKVMGSETHGMSQRGGSVIAHLKLGHFHGPLIRAGQADVLYSFEENETYRTLRFLRRGGLCFSNLPSPDRFNRGIREYLEQKGIAFLAYNAGGVAVKMGSVTSTNIALIGYSLGTGLIPFKHEDVRQVLDSISRGLILEMNLKALEKGFQDGRLAREKYTNNSIL